METRYVPQSIIMDEAAEERWRRADEIRVAESEFRRSRRRAFLRSLGGSVAARQESLPPRESGTGAFELAIESLSGLVDEGGRLTAGVPPLPRSLSRAWALAFTADSLDGGDPLLVAHLASGALYLAGGWKEWLRLELLRARGETLLSARLVGLPMLSIHEEQRSEGCCEEAVDCIAC